MSTLLVFAIIKPKAEHFSSARDAIVRIIPMTRAESGCLQFVLHEGNGSLYLYEEWSDEAALTLHHGQQYTADVFENYKSWLTEPVTVMKMTRVA